ncbi:MAG: SemiSWEET family sugar transporter [Betaproteobacteria bacterium]
MMGMTDAIGFLAGALTTIAFVPQAHKMYTTKSGKDISARMLTIFSVGVLLWLIYGIMIESVPVILTNVATLIVAGTIIALKIRYR